VCRARLDTGIVVVPREKIWPLRSPTIWTRGGISTRSGTLTTRFRPLCRYYAGMWTILLLIGSNIFMTFAWYGHLKFKGVSLWKVILTSWLIAFFEYCLQVPANRIGARTFSPDQLKVIQEVITLTVFGVFSIFYFGDHLHWNHFMAFGCLVAGAFFMFHKF
jgi:uncharacterized protein